MPTTLRLAVVRTLLAGGLAVAAQAASAQVPGLYVGTTSQGQTIEITVVEDNLQQPAFAGVTVFWQAVCTRSGPGRNVAWGVGTTPLPITEPLLNFEFRGNSLYEKFRFQFAGNNVSGTFVGRTPEFVDVFSATRQVQLCDSGNVSFNATRVEGARPQAAPVAGQAVRIEQ